MAELNQKLLDHFLNPRNVGTLEHPDAFGRVINPVNQYVTEVYLRIKDGTITDAKFKSFGCVITIAAASALTVILKGKNIQDILDAPDPASLILDGIVHELGEVPDENWHCPPTATQAFFTALLENETKQNNAHYIDKIKACLGEVQCRFDARLKTINKG